METLTSSIILKGQILLKYKSIFIVTYGRSGSTLLMGILNSIDGVHLKGENKNSFYNLFLIYKLYKNSKLNDNGSLGLDHAWYGVDSVDCDLLLECIREMGKVILSHDGADCIGFKEIRYRHIKNDFDEYLNFLENLYPRAAFVFNTRNHRDVVKSGWWRRQKKYKVISDLRQTEALFREYSSGKDNCFHISYEDLVNRSENFLKLFDFLGSTFQEDAVEEAFNIKYSHRTRARACKLARASKLWKVGW